MSIRADLLRSETASNKRTAKKKKTKTAFLDTLWDYATGKKDTRLETQGKQIDDIMEDPKKKLERKLREEQEERDRQEAEDAETETQDS